MRSFAWGRGGDHVAGRSGAAPGARDEVRAVGTPPRRPPQPRSGPLGPWAPAGTPASGGGWPGPERRDISPRLARIQVEGTWRRLIC